MFKKGQGISMNVIIVAAIALLVLVVLSVIFLGRLGNTNTQIGDCENKQGSCYSSVDGCPEGTTKMSWKCSIEEDVCCIPVGG